jgi:hypothetical protein
LTFFLNRSLTWAPQAEKDRRRLAGQLRRQAKGSAVKREEHAQILSEGGNPEAVFLARKRQGERAEKERELADRQQRNRLLIVETMVREEELLEKQKATRLREAAGAREGPPTSGRGRVPARSKKKGKAAGSLARRDSGGGDSGGGKAKAMVPEWI